MAGGIGSVGGVGGNGLGMPGRIGSLGDFGSRAVDATSFVAAVDPTVDADVAAASANAAIATGFDAGRVGGIELDPIADRVNSPWIQLGAPKVDDDQAAIVQLLANQAPSVDAASPASADQSPDTGGDASAMVAAAYAAWST